VSWIAIRELGYSGADVARYLGVTNSCITRSISSGKSPKVKDYIKPGIKTGCEYLGALPYVQRVQRDAHDFMRFSFYFWFFTEIADIYFFWFIKFFSSAISSKMNRKPVI
jgi:hypothetical protein